MSDIFHSVRDLHTNYLLPAPFNGKIAFLPFLIEEYFEDGEPTYLVLATDRRASRRRGFAPGVEVTHWNGIPIARAVDVNAARFAGSNAAARRARGVESLTHPAAADRTCRRTRSGSSSATSATTASARELRQKWLVADNLPSFTATADDVSCDARTALGLDLGAGRGEPGQDAAVRARRSSPQRAGR